MLQLVTIYPTVASIRYTVCQTRPTQIPGARYPRHCLMLYSVLAKRTCRFHKLALFFLN